MSGRVRSIGKNQRVFLDLSQPWEMTTAAKNNVRIEFIQTGCVWLSQRGIDKITEQLKSPLIIGGGWELLESGLSVRAFCVHDIRASHYATQGWLCASQRLTAYRSVPSGALTRLEAVEHDFTTGYKLKPGMQSETVSVPGIGSVRFVKID